MGKPQKNTNKGRFVLRQNDLQYISIYLLIVISLFNTSQYGTSFSWIVGPAILSLFAALIGRSNILHITMKHYLGLLFWIICVVSTLLSPIVEVQRDIITFALFVILYIFMTSMENDADKSRKVILVYILVATIGCLVIIYNYINGIYYNSWFHRSTVTFLGVSRDPNYVSGFIAPLPILILTYQPIYERRYARIIKAILVVVCLFALIIDGSRGGIISAVLPVVLYILSREKKIKKRIAEVILFIITCIIGYRLIVDYLPSQTVARLLFQTSGDTRSALWKAGLNAFYQNPIIGQGIGSASQYSKAIAGNYSHNMYIDMLACSGIVGSIVYLLFILENVKCGYKLKECLKNNLDLILIAFILPQFFVNGFNTVSMWLPLIMMHHLNLYYMNCGKKSNEY